jgi:hypothetical protein
MKPLVDLTILRSWLERWERQQPERVRVDEVGAYVELDGWPVYVQLTASGPSRFALAGMQGAVQEAVRLAGWDMGFETTAGKCLAFVAATTGERVCGDFGEPHSQVEISCLSALVVTLERANAVGRAA